MFCFGESSFAASTSPLELRVVSTQLEARGSELKTALSAKVAALASHGQVLAVALDDATGTVQLLNMHTLEVRATRRFGAPVRSLAFADEGDRLFCATTAAVFLTDTDPAAAAAGAAEEVASGEGKIASIAVAGGRLLVGSEDGRVKIVDLATRQVVQRLKGAAGSVAQISASGDFVAALTRNSLVVFVWRLNPAGGERSGKVWKFLASETPIAQFVFGAGEGARLAVMALLEDSRVAVFEETSDAGRATLAPVRLVSVPGARLLREGDCVVACETRSSLFKFVTLAEAAAGKTPKAGRKEKEAREAAPVAAAVAAVAGATALASAAEVRVVGGREGGAAVAPALASLAPTIRQGLRTKDKKLLETVAGCPVRATMAETARDLEASEVAGFLEYLVETAVSNPAQLPSVAEWVREVARFHAALIVSQSSLRKLLEPLHALITARVRNLNALQLLAGRLVASMGATKHEVEAARWTATKPLVTWRDE